MYNCSRVQPLVLLFGATLLASCSIDRAGLNPEIGAGSGGVVGTGGVPGGTGSTSGSGGLNGTGGVTDGTGGVADGTGGVADGTGGVGQGTGGITGTGSVTGTGGVRGTGGVTGAGGVTGTGGVRGTGGITGTGGVTGACNASTCPNGCCMANICVTSHNDKHCGTAGAACFACTACYQCSNAGTCELNPSATWNLTCSSVTVAPTKPLNVMWDVPAPGISPPPDPYCQFVLDGVSQARTTTLLNTFMPVWNQTITPNDITESMLVSTAGRWQVGIVDEDTGPMPVDPICASTPRLTPADFAAGTVVLPSSTPSCTDLTIQLECTE